MIEHQLQVQALSCIRGERLLWSELQFQVASGELLQITGENGCGKTSLLKILAGLTPSQTGSVLWKGQCIHQQDYQQQIFYLSHQSAVKNALTVKENIYGLNLNKNLKTPQFRLAVDTLGLEPFLDHYGYQLSQGQKQRLALARMLLSDSLLWILDEPLTALDNQIMENVQDIFKQQLDNGGLIVLTTHRPLTQKNLVSHTLVLKAHETTN